MHVNVYTMIVSAQDLNAKKFIVNWLLLIFSFNKEFSWLCAENNNMKSRW